MTSRPLVPADARGQIESFNAFLLTKLQDIVLENSDIKHQSKKGGVVVSSAACTFQKVFIRSPCIREADGTYRELMPQECRLRGLTYNVSVYVNILEGAVAAIVDSGPIAAIPCDL